MYLGICPYFSYFCSRPQSRVFFLFFFFTASIQLGIKFRPSIFQQTKFVQLDVKMPVNCLEANIGEVKLDMTRSMVRVRFKMHKPSFFLCSNIPKNMFGILKTKIDFLFRVVYKKKYFLGQEIFSTMFF